MGDSTIGEVCKEEEMMKERSVKEYEDNTKGV